MVGYCNLLNNKLMMNVVQDFWKTLFENNILWIPSAIMVSIIKIIISQTINVYCIIEKEDQP